MYANTYQGLFEWYKAMYEKLGWMTLVKAKGYGYKIKPYKMSIKHLINSIEHLMTETKDCDRIHDLHVMRMNTKCLYETACKCL